MGAQSLFVVNLLVCALLAAAFAAIATFDRQRTASVWFAVAYLCGMIYFVTEIAVPLFGGGVWLVTVGYVGVLLALTLFCIGLARFYDRDLPLRLIALLFAVCVVVKLGSDLLDRGSLLRLVLYQLPYALMQAIGAWIVLSSRRNRVDAVLGALLCLSALHFLGKPFVAVASGGVGATPADYVHTLYAQISHASGAVISVGIALLLLMILVRELLTKITEISVTDPLSGLLNRRGFEEQMRERIEEARRSGLPLSLIVCDLDRFKAVNDSYGHAAGDRLIKVFARKLEAAVADRHLVGRIGGEEFAILALRANLHAARLLAEAVRISFGRLPVADMPESGRFTASFGVAELQDGEGVEDIFRRADHALYFAKQEGRDCVRAAAPPPAPAGGSLPLAG